MRCYMNPFSNFFGRKKQSNQDGAESPEKDNAGEQTAEAIGGFVNKLKLLLPIGGGAAFGSIFLVILPIIVVAVPVVMIMIGLGTTNIMASEIDGTGTVEGWGSGESALIDALEERNENYMSRGIYIDLPLVTSAIFIGNNVIGTSMGECTMNATESGNEDDPMSNIQIQCENEQATQSYDELKREADFLMEGMVDGDSVKSEEEYRAWLHDNFIENKLIAIGYEIPSNAEEKEQLFNDMINQIYFYRDMYESVLENSTSSSTSGMAAYKVRTVDGVRIVSGNIMVRLLDCFQFTPLEGEELVEFENYVLGTTYQEIGPEAAKEAAKAQAIAVRSYTLTRGKVMGGEIGKISTEGENTVIQMRACTDDQAFCNPDKGCWSDRDGGEKSNLHSGYRPDKNWTREVLSESAPLRSYVAETNGQVAVDKDGFVLYTSYKWDDTELFASLAAQGLTAPEIIKKNYPQTVEVSTMLSGNGSLEGGPDFNNDLAWRHPNNNYDYGQCTWFAAGRLYELYGFYDGSLGNGNMWVQNLTTRHPDLFVRASTPIPGSVFSGDASHIHVGIVSAVNGNKITIQEGNLKQEVGDNYDNYHEDSWDYAIRDWQTVTITLAELRNRYGNVTFANPVNSPAS